MSQAVIHVCCLVLAILITNGSAQLKQQQNLASQKQQRQRQWNHQFAAGGKCSMRIKPGDSNRNNVVAGGRIIMYDEPCVGFNPHGRSLKNSARKEGCRKAAYKLAQAGAKPECGQIVHGQCLQAQKMGKRGGNPGPAACYVLAKLKRGFRLKLLRDCADGMGFDTYAKN